MEVAECKEGYFINPDNIKLYKQIYQPDDQVAKAIIFLCHGLFEHCQSSYYASIIKPLNNIGCVVLTHDHYGHGRSDGNRGMLSNLDLLIRDVILDIEETMKELSLPETIPIFLYGHSLGGLISVLITQKKKNFISGMILEAPALTHDVNNAAILVIRFINYLYPACPLRKATYDEICRDKQHIQNIKNDKLHIHSKLSAMTGLTIINSINQCKISFSEVDIPVIVGHGDADRLTLLSGSQKFIEEISSIDKTLIIYPNAKHRLRMEIDNVNIKFANTIVAWLNERIN